MLLKRNTKLSIYKEPKAWLPTWAIRCKEEIRFQEARFPTLAGAATSFISALSFAVSADDQSRRCTAKVESRETSRLVLPRSLEL